MIYWDKINYGLSFTNNDNTNKLLVYLAVSEYIEWQIFYIFRSWNDTAPGGVVSVHVDELQQGRDDNVKKI